MIKSSFNQFTNHATMKLTSAISTVALATVLHWPAAAQPLKEEMIARYGEEAVLHWPALREKTPSSYWVVNGEIYDNNKSTMWKKMDGKIVKVLPNTIVVETFIVATKHQAVVVRRLNQNYGNSTRYHDETQMVDVGKERVPGRKIIIRNYPLQEKPTVGKTISFQAMQTGTSDYDGDKLEVWDLGTMPTTDDFKKLKIDTEERQRAAKKELDEQRRVATEKTAAVKQAAGAKALKWNQEQADKGDAYGLTRMGERYRDGDGVPKDLAKAREYFTKATAAGSLDAPDALAKLNQASTNSPATKP